MKKIITAIGNPILNEYLKKEEDIIVIGNDIQYQDGIFELLEKDNNINLIIISEIIIGENTIEKLIEKIKIINRNIKIIIILENKNEELENKLIAKGIIKIFYHNNIEINKFIKFIKENKENENEELKQEINNLKNLILENKKIDEENKSKKINNKIKNNLFEKLNNKYLNKKIAKREKEIISISGPNGAGKSIITVNLAKVMALKKEKILIIDFDILNNNIHTILGVKKHSIKNNYEIENLIIKVNKNIDLLSTTEFLFGSKEKIDINKIENTINKLKEKYNKIIIDTSSECFFDFTKTIIKLSNKNIFVTDTNILEIKKAKELLNIYINNWKINKNKFNILFNKYNKESISINILKELFCEFNIIGFLKYNSKYNKLINKNNRFNLIDKKLKKEYLNLKNIIN